MAQVEPQRPPPPDMTVPSGSRTAVELGGWGVSFEKCQVEVGSFRVVSRRWIILEVRFRMSKVGGKRRGSNTQSKFEETY